MKAPTRRQFLAAALSSAGTLALAAPPERAIRPLARPSAGAPPVLPTLSPEARPTMEDLIAEAGLGGTVGFALADPASGVLLESGAADTRLPPASTLKSVTTLYALDRLGPDHRWTTRVLGTAPVVDGTLDGDLILAGGGDPVLDTNALAELAAALSDAGLAAVSGRFLVWGGALPYLEEIEPGQLDHLGYNPAVSGLNLNFNRVNFTWQRAGADYTLAMDARSDLYQPEVTMARMRVVDRSMPVYTYEGDATSDRWTVAKARLGEAGSRWLPVRHPALYAGDVMRTFAAARGLTLPAAEEIAALPAGTVELAARESAPLTEIARDMLYYSTNLTAEVLGMSAAATEGPLESHAESAARMTAWFAERFGAGPVFADHSGLSDATAISAAEMAGMLVAVEAEGSLLPLLKPIPLTDGAGAPLTFPRGEVAAKTGTLNFVSALAGYIETLEGDRLAFAILCANAERREEVADSQDDLPEGASYYNGRAKRLQQRMLQRWGLVGVDDDVMVPEAAALAPVDDVTPGPGGG
ncbi:D-alanyl-D-alanine carboxypeptidase/D-alanyl-D-alanine endopeptidase [Wenxinia saemankumensis]|uniref:D-alanyl-D-alanine carboxypeptidase / D-alanyl-D-alanine-endopeptidase (Penicillin-binding protein 4) n=1 Tax=Wenxinia saemankumensis TaxID=1447782 RepID=A0A1M6EWR1_9RHOB|nr:D-alanyl-D-alanine carboxypeptidase/D-alanyl-D-alanine-endopeptidase [Wenxinia saemankumensis]SHI89811.1 D-alanyl-D-alanine carboxypeptidase / D-alanyl-D-alanine-endopeptidase (penicillin-binding protein 4) [Wenxinia saemankumensis]